MSAPEPDRTAAIRQALDQQVHSHTRPWIEAHAALDALVAERDRLQHIIECADTPLMRDVLAERDQLREALVRIAGTPTKNSDPEALEMARAANDARSALAPPPPPPPQPEHSGAANAAQVQVGETSDPETRVMRCPECGRVASIAPWVKRPICVHYWDGSVPEVWDADETGDGHTIEMSRNAAYRTPGPDTWTAMVPVGDATASEAEAGRND